MQAGGHRFDPGTLHHKKLTEVAKQLETSLSFLKEEFKRSERNGSEGKETEAKAETKDRKKKRKTDAMHLEN